MSANYTIKQAVVTALTILTLSAQNQALAMGLGNIDVKSHLGEPLRASIKVQGASEIKNASCFRILDNSGLDNQLTHANFKLSNIDNDVAILTVTSDQVLNDPIVNLSVITDCDINIQRDYVVLLDPPLATEEGSFEDISPTVIEQPVITKKKSKKNKDVEDAPKYSQTIIVGETVAEKPDVKKALKNKTSKKSNTEKEIVLTAGYNLDKPNETKPSETNLPAINTKTSGARLSISSGDASNQNSTSPQLMLDRQLHITPETSAKALSPEMDIDMQDEVTVMTHRLAHLEKQLGALSVSNQKLNAENTLTKQQLAESNSWNNKFSWLGYIIGGALVFGSVTIADKWRRRRQDEQLAIAQMEWEKNAATSYNQTNQDNEVSLMGINVEEANDDFFESDTKEAPIVKAAIDTIEEENIEKDEDIFTNSVPTYKSETPIAIEELVAENNVLDHADVFLSHGRVSLAIQLLQNHLIDFPKQSVTIWMFLLDLIAKENLPALYEQTALECKEYFNIKIADYTQPEADNDESLESFPRITAGLQQVWGTPAALAYLDDLIYNSRLEVRIGFHKNVIEELLMLKSVAHEELKSAQVIYLGEKKIEMLELKEAQLAAKKEEKIKKMQELTLEETTPKLAQTEETPFDRFEFNLVEYNG
jgi:hypothetical protein